jgi:hypothetical protein
MKDNNAATKINPVEKLIKELKHTHDETQVKAKEVNTEFHHKHNII